MSSNKSRTQSFWDGITSFTNDLANKRNVSTTNAITHRKIDPSELRATYKTGLGSTIIRKKTGYALTDTIEFPDGEAQKKFYNEKLAKHVKEAVRFQLAFGRGLIVIQIPGQSMAEPLLSSQDLSNAIIRVFSGDMVTTNSASVNLEDVRYLEPDFYMVRGFPIHYSRVVDFKYFKPVELEAAIYHYGGISEFELIHAQLINDSIVERSSAHTLEKNATLFYKVKGFKNQLASKKEGALLNYFSRLEDVRSIYGAGIVDQEDTIEVHGQTLTGLADADVIALRRLAMVTGIPFSELVGESPKGLNATGDNEEKALGSMIKALQGDYILPNVNDLMALFGFGNIKFSENQSRSANEIINYETKVIANAEKLMLMGENHGKYLKDKGVDVETDSFTEVFGDGIDDELDDE